MYGKGKDKLKKKQTYSLNDLPQFSPWPARLLGIDSYQVRKKTHDQICREFDVEKWGKLLEWATSQGCPVSVSDVNDKFHEKNLENLCYDDGVYIPLSIQQAQAKYLYLVEQVILRFIPASSLVELGAGYGNIILNLISKNIFAGLKFYAGEYTQSGIELIRLLGKTSGKEIKVGFCDLSQINLTDLDIPENSIFFTSHACHYIPKYSSKFVEAFRRFKPRAIVHFEPFYEHCKKNVLLDLMRRRYIEINDYNTNLLTILREQQVAGRIQIHEEKPFVFGFHPLLTISIVVWSFVK